MSNKKVFSHVPSPYDLSGMKQAMQRRRLVRVVSVPQKPEVVSRPSEEAKDRKPNKT
jgi:hypothetical protein